MAKPKKQPVNLAGVVQAELKSLTPAQVSTFRRELERRIPETVKQAAEAARLGRPDDKQEAKK
jgi:hypothetical protein